jgi:hypothetical protein
MPSQLRCCQLGVAACTYLPSGMQSACSVVSRLWSSLSSSCTCSCACAMTMIPEERTSETTTWWFPERLGRDRQTLTITRDRLVFILDNSIEQHRRGDGPHISSRSQWPRQTPSDAAPLILSRRSWAAGDRERRHIVMQVYTGRCPSVMDTCHQT